MSASHRFNQAQLDLFGGEPALPPQPTQDLFAAASSSASHSSAPETACAFADWYQALRGYPPYPWQSRLAARIAAGDWPKALHLPTGSGKTSLIDIWAWARSLGLPGIPRRVYWCVNRRLVVDSVALQADFLQQALPDLQTSCLRGGLNQLGDLGLVDPSRPAIIPTTIDQLGSRLLFRAYGSSHWVAPMHAGLVGQDALIVLDEAHLSEAFMATLNTVERQHRQALGLPWRCLYLSATLHDSQEMDDVFCLEADDYAHPQLQRRLKQPKPTRLVECRKESLVAELVKQALALRAEGAAVVAVVVNRVATARAVFSQLLEHDTACLLTGRIRETDRAALLAEFLPGLLAGSRAQGRPSLFLVATQTIEVGADLDFDALVSECASLSALRQRFGRLNRTGELDSASGVIVCGKSVSTRNKNPDDSFPDENSQPEKEDPVYGEDSKKAWDWLLANALKSKRDKWIDLSAWALQDKTFPEEIRPDYPVLGDADLAVLAQTSGRRHIDITPWLHGYSQRLEVAVIWRADLGENAQDDWPVTLAFIPPLATETLNLPVWELRRWLNEHHANALIGVWDGDELTVHTALDVALTPGMTVVLPAHYGGCDAWGWAPDSRTAVTDLADTPRRRRIHPALQDEAAALLADYTCEDSPISENELLDRLAIEPEGAWQIVSYPGGLLILLGAPVPEQVAGVRISLKQHLRGTAELARSLLPKELPPELAKAVIRAALWHDVGKRDVRFQQMLGSDGHPPLAKSLTRTREQARRARQLSGLPDGWRHEVASAAVVKDRALIRYLIATHHGRGRCWLPAQPDSAAWQQANGPQWPADHARLTAQFDPWGLAYLETLVRLADWAESRREAEGGKGAVS